MKNRGIYLLLFLAVILGGSFFILNLRNYWRGSTEFTGGGKSFLSERAREEFKDTVKVSVKDGEYYINLFRDKNLFKVLGKEKSPFVVEEEAVLDAGKELTKFELLGIVSSGGTSKALIKDAVSGKTFYGAVGEKLDGFAIKEIMPDKIILEREGKTFELKL